MKNSSLSFHECHCLQKPSEPALCLGSTAEKTEQLEERTGSNEDTQRYHQMLSRLLVSTSVCAPNSKQTACSETSGLCEAGMLQLTATRGSTAKPHRKSETSGKKKPHSKQPTRKLRSSKFRQLPVHLPCVALEDGTAVCTQIAAPQLCCWVAFSLLPGSSQELMSVDLADLKLAAVPLSSDQTCNS